VADKFVYFETCPCCSISLKKKKTWPKASWLPGSPIFKNSKKESVIKAVKGSCKNFSPKKYWAVQNRQSIWR
jgi:hypothetical protein